MRFHLPSTRTHEVGNAAVSFKRHSAGRMVSVDHLTYSNRSDPHLQGSTQLDYDLSTGGSNTVRVDGRKRCVQACRGMLRWLHV